jgi:hypothetical protein
MNMNWFRGVNDIDSLDARGFNGWWSKMQSWWNDHDSGKMAFSVLSFTGTKLADNVPAGRVGEYLSSGVSRSLSVSISPTGTQVNVASISLPPGDFLLFGQLGYTFSGNTTVLQGGISTTTASLSGSDTIASQDASGQIRSILQYTAGSFVNDSTIPPMISRVNISSTTTYYLVSTVNFSSGTASTYGSLTARRMR